MNSESISVVVPKDLKKQSEQLAKKKNISRNALIRLALTEFIERSK